MFTLTHFACRGSRFTDLHVLATCDDRGIAIDASQDHEAVRNNRDVTQADLPL